MPLILRNLIPEVLEMKKKLIAVLILIAVVLTVGLVACNNDSETDVRSIEINAAPKTVYVQGQELDLSGGIINVIYDNGFTAITDILPSMVSGYDAQVIGKQMLRIRYKGASVSLEITVVPPDVISVELADMPAKTEYVQEQLLDLTGGRIKINYDGGASRYINITEDMCSGYDMSKTGTQIVNITLVLGAFEYSIQYSINVTQKELIGIEVSKNPTKYIYYAGDESLDLTDGVIFLQYNNGYPEYVNMTDLQGLTVSWDGNTVTNNSVVTLSYGGKTTKFTVQVMIKDIVEFKLLSSPVKNQLVGTELDLTGLSFEVTYNNYETEVISYPSNLMRVESYNKNLTGIQRLELVFYTGSVPMDSRYYLDVIVEDKEMERLEIILPEGEKIYQDTRIDAVGRWEYVIVYNNGEVSEKRKLSDNMIIRNPNDEVYLYSEPGTYSWTVQYMTIELEYVFEVLPLEVESMEIIGETPVKSFRGYEINPEGLFLKIFYNNGEEKLAPGGDYLPVTLNMITGYDKNKLGLQSAKITYSDEYEDGFTIDLPVIVVKKVYGSIGITKYPVKMNYILNEEFDYSGLVITLTYEGDSASTDIAVFDEDWTFECDDWVNAGRVFNSTGTKSIYITYQGLDDPDTQGVFVEVEVFNRPVSITTNNAFGNVVVGGELDYTGIVYTLNYEVGSKIILFNEEEQEFMFYDVENGTYAALKGTITHDYNKADTQTGYRTVNISYTENGVTVEYVSGVTVIAKNISGIQVAKLPNKLTYIYNRDNVIDREGMEVHILYDNDTRERLSLDDEELYISEFDNASPGEKQVVLTYKNRYTTSFNIQLTEATVSAISFAGDIPDIEIKEGVDITAATIALDGRSFGEFEVTLTKSDGTTETVTISSLSDFRISDYNKFSTGSQSPKLVYESLGVSFNVTVIPRTLTSLEVLANGRIIVIEEMIPDLSGLQLNLTFDNGLSTMLTSVRNENILVSDANPGGFNREDLTTGNRDVSVIYTYNGVTVSGNISITVISKTLTSIGMYEFPKTQYIEGEALDYSGGSIIVYYNNGTTEVLPLSNATLNETNSRFNVNALRFDNSEFSGFSKLQTIFINYTSATDEVFETEYDIMMNDRRYAEVVFNTDNRYSFVYGDIDETNVPKFSVRGYNAYGDESRNFTFDLSRIKIEYVRYEDRFEPRDPSTDYTKIPVAVGQYVIVITYDSLLYNDSVHNSFVDISGMFTISKRTIYISIDDVSKIYGTTNPLYSIFAYGADTSGNMDKNAQAFYNNDTFFTAGFVGENPTEYASVAYDKDGNPVKCFNIRVLNSSGQVINVNERTGASDYTINISGLESKNYNIVYLDGKYSIEKRKVAVTPNEVTAVYGNTNIMISYSTAAVPGDPNSGLYGNDVLTGNPIMESGRDAGQYRITAGSLSNNNYEIIFDGSKFVTIQRRNIYVRADSVDIIYGNALPEFTVRFFANPECSDTNAFAFSTDNAAGLGILSFAYPDGISGVASYELNPIITPYGLGEVPDGVTDISKNYNVNFVNGYIVVLPRPVTVEAHSKVKIYGDSDPELTYTASLSSGSDSEGLIIIDPILNTYEQLRGSLARMQGEAKGRYTITIGDLRELNKNYNINYINAEFSIVEKTLIAELPDEALSKSYDGKLPSVSSDAIILRELKDGEIIDFDKSGIDMSAITIGFVNPTKDSASYTVTISNSDTNFSVAFAPDKNYIYTITPIVVDIEYVDLPDGKEYKRSPYVFSAKVPDAQRQNEYNDDGSVKLDDYNNPIKDVIDVTLSLNSATDAGLYSTAAILLNNSNYILSDEARSTIQFTIKERELQIVVNSSVISEDGVTVVREFNGSAANLNNDIEVKNLPEGFNASVTLNIINPDTTSGSAPRDVRYDSDGVTVIAYDIEPVQLQDPNYNIVLAADYKYKIVPRDVTVTIISTFLSKTYDGRVPSIGNGCQLSANSLSASDLIFEFERETSDGKSNSDVGTYSVRVSTANRNHTVRLAQVYVYTINSATVNVRVNLVNKEYDGTSISVNERQVVLSGLSGVSPVIRSFANYGNFEAFRSAILNLLAAAQESLQSLRNISFDSIDYAKILVNTALEKINALDSAFKNTNIANNFSQTSLNNFSSYAADIRSQLTGIKELLDTSVSGSNEDLIGQRALAISSAENALNIVSLENVYLAFIFYGTDSNAADVGAYSFTMEQSDYNKNYRLQNASDTVMVTRRTIFMKIVTEDGSSELSSIYGDSIKGLKAEFYADSAMTGAPLEGLTIQGNLDISFGNAVAPYYAAGTYSIIPDAGFMTDENYYVRFTGASYEIKKRELIVNISDKIGTGEDGTPELHYGSNITEANLRYWNLDSTTPLIGNDALNSIITYQSEFICLLPDGTPITSPGAQPETGTYTVTINEDRGFSADNYSFIYTSGTVTILKKTLRIAVSNDMISRIYGENLQLEFNKADFAYGETVDTLIAEVGSIRYPELITNEFDGATVANLNTLSGSTIYKVALRDNNPNQFKNYEIKLNESYNVVINYAILELDFAGIGGGNKLEAVYGSNPEYSAQFIGFKNQDQADFNSKFNFNNGSVASFNFAWSVQEGLSRAFGTDPERDYTLNVTFQNWCNGKYTVSVNPINYNVLQKELEVKFNKDITVVNDGSGSLVNMYAAAITTTGSGDEQSVERVDLLSGNYAPSDISISGFVYNESADSIFVKFADNVAPSQGDTSKIYQYIDKLECVEHSLVYDTTPGENTIALSGLRFLNESSDAVPNYAIKYAETRLMIYNFVQRLEAATDSVLINDASGISELEIIATNGMGGEVTLNLSDSRLQWSSPQNLPKDETARITVEYSDTYNLNGYTGPSAYLGVPVDTSGFRTQVVNSGISTEVAIRIYDNAVQTVQNNVGVGEIDAKSVEQQRISGTAITKHDLIETSLRFEPFTFGEAIRYYMLINGSENGNKLYFEVVGGAAGYTARVGYVVNGILQLTQDLSFVGINLLDGFTHDITIHYDKRLNTVYAAIDGIVSSVISIPYDDVTIPGVDGAPDEIIKGYKPSESSYTGYIISGAKAWVKNFDTYKLGYSDKYATLARAAVSNQVIHFVTSYSGGVSLDVATLFEPNTVRNPNYTFYYYVNGRALAVKEYGATYVETGYYFSYGTHTARLVIKNGDSVISEYSLALKVSVYTFDAYVESNNVQYKVDDGAPVELYTYDNGDNSLTLPGTVSTNRTHSIVPGGTGLQNYRESEFVFRMDLARTADGSYATTQIHNEINLMTTDSTRSARTGSGASFTAITLDLNHIVSSGSSYYATSLYVYVNSTRYNTVLTQNINWSDGGLYKIKFYLNYVNGYGSSSFNIEIYRDGTSIFSSQFGADTGTSLNIPQYNFVRLVNNTSGYSPSIIACDSRITLYRLSLGNDKAAGYDFLKETSDSTIIRHMKGTEGVTIANNEKAYLSDYNGEAFKAYYDSVKFRFKLDSTGGATVRFYINADSVDSKAGGRGLYITYQKTVISDAITINSLTFGFYDGNTEYRLQVPVVSAPDLADGQEHMIEMLIGRSATPRAAGFGNLIANTMPGTVNSSTGTIMLDGTRLSDVYYPYDNGAGYWYNSGNTFSSAPATTTRNFLSRFSYAYATVTNGDTAALTIYEISLGNRISGN